MASSSLLLLWMGCVQVASNSDPDNFNKLQQILYGLPSNITKLNLSHNAIEISEADIKTLKNYSQLTELYLNNNRLTVLPGHMFDNLTQLNILNVSYNNISRVEPKAFAGLANLKNLDLSHNSIPSLPPRVFANLSSLEALYLQGNGLHVLENGTFGDLKHQKYLDLDENPWNCSCAFLWVIHCLNDLKVQIGQGAICAIPEDQAGKSILNSSTMCFPGIRGTETPTEAPTVTATASSMQTTHTVSTGHTGSGNLTDSKKESVEDIPLGGNSWKFLLGVVAFALSTSLLIVCMVKSPKWYMLLFDYRHQRLHEEESDFFATRCHANFSLDVEQMETSAQELGGSPEEEDGYIEDGYIDTGDYKDHTEL
ncbi:hypothetical protein AAFF_G00272520 [Aldrovandia affinis]|uniref:Leucine-rich repeat-containing protein 19 n=1 Tax=Aldrovandia affinis TaxID=143900 RepID=A0AAD7RDC0_9TELE|nr:hypothetical protein AAFF_G00272520 [Aldrovandia affinis]